MSLKKKSAASSKVVDCIWYELFEASYAEETCDKIKDQMRQPHIYGTSHEGLRESCRRYLLIPLDQYIREHRRPEIRGCQGHVEAAAGLFEAVESIRRHLRKEALRPVTEPDAESLTLQLLFAWYRFIAHGAGPSIYDTLPKKKAQAKKAATKKRGNGRELTVQHVVEFMRERGLSTLSDIAAEEVAKLHPADSKGGTVSVRTVQRRLQEARERGLLPPAT